MTMNNPKAVVAVILFIGLMATPFILSAGADFERAELKLGMPTHTDKCVAETQYMRDSHMDLLNTWRDEVVREGNRNYASPWDKKDCPPPGWVEDDGKCHFERSLSRTCMSCHKSRADFCTKCHSFTNVDPYCWDCHVEPRGR